MKIDLCKITLHLAKGLEGGSSKDEKYLVSSPLNVK